MTIQSCHSRVILLDQYAGGTVTKWKHMIDSGQGQISVVLDTKLTVQEVKHNFLVRDEFGGNIVKDWDMVKTNDKDYKVESKKDDEITSISFWLNTA